MVVPVRENAPPVNLSETRKFLGNNQNLKFTQNTSTMLLIGNNCTLKILENFGRVNVIGNNCTIDISQGPGSVTYTGNNGKVTIDGDIGSASVTYVGSNGSISSKNSGESSVKSDKFAASAPKNSTFTPHFVDKAYIVHNNIRLSVENPIDLKGFMPIPVFF